MSGCSLQEAFPDTAKQSGQIAKKEERYKAKKCAGPALTFLKEGISDLDADRQTPPLPPSEKLEGRKGYHDAIVQGFVSEEKVKKVDVIGENSPQLQRPSPDFTRTMYGDPVPSYFGKSVEEKFADFSASPNDTAGYKIDGSDFLGSFAAQGVAKASGKPMRAPSVSDAWKPMTPSGARTSFFDVLPEPGVSGDVFSLDEKQSLLKKLDTLFARLDDLESKRNEYAHAEVTLFILSGLFLMFGFETVRKFQNA